MGSNIAALPAVQASAGKVDLFLKVTGQRQGQVKGEANDDVHAGEIELASWSWGMRAATGLAGTGAGRKGSVNQLRVVKTTDAASCALMSMLRNNEPIKEALLIARKAGKFPHEFLKIKLELARLTSFDITSGDGSGAIAPTETWEFSFQKVEVQYVPQGEDGLPRGGMMFATDVTETVGA
jgi:type VI secretion system secreted protein Hcp